MRPAIDPISPGVTGAMGQDSPGPVLSRRAMLRPAAALAALWAGSRSARAAETNEVTADVDPGAVLHKLVRRLCIGPTTADYAQAESLGYDGYLDYHLNYLVIDDSACDARLAQNPATYAEPWDLYGLDYVLVTNQIQDVAITRAIYSKRQLFEKAAEFWRDHFNIVLGKYPGHVLLPMDDRLVVRENALGSFRYMLLGSALSSAMLAYLDNDLNTVTSRNENYARELMELHTLGVDNGYTQHDVIELARCLTGWTLTAASAEPGTGYFAFNHWNHDQGPKSLLGRTLPPNGGFTDGYTMVDFLALHPNTAGFVGRKLVTRFVGENAPEGVVSAVRQTFLDTEGDIAAMLRVMLRPNVLHDAPLKLKRPLQLFASALRVLPHTLTHLGGIRALLAAAGHLPFTWAPPNGFPDKVSHWSGLLVPRWDFAFKMAEGSIAGLSVDFNGFFGGITAPSEVMDHIDQQFFGGAMPAVEKDAIHQFLVSDPFASDRRAEAVALAICAPSFQWH